ncbi:MAG: HD domain-containing protein [Clostridia bacterium]|nr:HD domain-containing protein [Clostridia bacterium]
MDLKELCAIPESEYNRMLKPVRDHITAFFGKDSKDLAHALNVLKYVQLLLPEVAPDDWARFRAEAAALVHDITCPLCREVYGECPGDLQEQKSELILDLFFEKHDLPPQQVKRIIWMVSHHHTPEASDEPDFRLLIEADLLANLQEQNLDLFDLRQLAVRTMRTQTGQEELRKMLGPMVQKG